MQSPRCVAKYGAIRFLSCPGRAGIVSKFRDVSGTACKMPSPTPPKSAKVELRACPKMKIESFQGLESQGACAASTGRSSRRLDQSRVLRTSESFTSACQCIRTPDFTGITIESDSKV